MRLMRLAVVFLIIVLCFFNISYAFDRVVILAPDSSDIFLKLGLESKVVGITRHVHLFKNAKRVGTHLKPNIEIIKSLKPDLIVVKRKKDIDVRMFGNTKIYTYNPQTLDGILEQIENISKMFKKDRDAEKLISKLKQKLQLLKPLKKHPKVVFEVMQTPYIAAGRKSIVNDIIKKAGGINIINSNRYFVRISNEKIALLKPDVYVYEVGPMNKNPSAPNTRALFKNLKMKIIKVDESKFLRSSTVSFDSVVYLNKIFKEVSKNGR